MEHIRILVILSLLLNITAGYAGPGKEKDGSAATVYESVANKNYTIDVNRALPMRGKAVSLTSGYALAIEGDSVTSDLPYFGVAHNAPYGGSESLRFKSTAEEYSVKLTKKKMTRIEFKTRSNDDYYTFKIDISPNGTATIYVSSAYKQGITFYGKYLK
ncbi:MAG: DUF4251 domain-containing protein [Bacteroidales bacterium]|nr:DUF4251 domain-containing protein [Bacteroidales bacterium]